MKSMKKIVLGLLVSLLFSGSAYATELFNLVTDKSGMHRITYEQLRDQGVNLLGARHQRFALSLNGEPVPIRTQGITIRNRSLVFFGPGGFIEFYAPEFENRYTEDQAFTLSFVSRRELATSRIDFGARTASVNTALTSSTQYQHTQLIEENIFYDDFSPTETDPWTYGQTLSLFPTPVYNFELEGVVGGSATAEIRAQMYGVLDFDIEGNDHHYSVTVNDVLLGDQQFDGNSQDFFEASNVLVNEGANTIQYNYIPIAELAFDRISLNQFWVTYPRVAIAQEGYLQGEFNSLQNSVSGLGSDVASVYHLRNDGGIDSVVGAVASVDDATVFSTGGVSGEYVVVSEQGFRVPSIALIQDQDDLRSGDAEYLVITHSSLEGDALDRLVELRQAKYSVKVVDVEQIYGQFGNHVPSPDAIQAYIKYAAENLSTRFVTIIGNDTYDYLGFVSDSIGLIPTKYVNTPAGIITVNQTPSDAAYGDLDLDGIPDLPVGRIVARTQEELSNVVAKIEAYEAREGYVGRILLATDRDDVAQNVSFRQDAAEIVAAMPAEWGNSIRDDFRAYPDVDGHQGAQDKLFNVANAGVSLISYIGHSSPNSWAFTNPRLLTSSQISDFDNVGKPFVVTQWGCWNTYFVSPDGQSMADRFLVAGDNAAVASLGASTLTVSTDELALGIELNKRLFDEGVTIGEALIEAKKALSLTLDSPAMQLGYQIIGDPALVINP